MEEVIKYFEQLEARIATLEAEVAELKNRPLPEPQVVEKVVEKRNVELNLPLLPCIFYLLRLRNGQI